MCGRVRVVSEITTHDGIYLDPHLWLSVCWCCLCVWGCVSVCVYLASARVWVLLCVTVRSPPEIPISECGFVEHSCLGALVCI